MEALLSLCWFCRYRLRWLPAYHDLRGGWPRFCGDGRADDVPGEYDLYECYLAGNVVSAMQGFDLWWPVNKAAYTSASVYWLHSYMPMAAIMAAGMVYRH